MTKLILVRHGQTVWNKLGKYQGQADIELSEAGKEQARLLGENFPIDKVDAVYASALKRAVETAEEIAKRFNIPVVPCEEFKEISFGDWEGLTYNEIHAEWQVQHDLMFKQPGNAVCPNGESFADVQSRAVKKMKELIELHAGETVVIAAHGGVIRTMLCHALGLPLDNMWRIRQDNTAINIITAYDEGMVVELVNSTGHLTEAAKYICDNFSR